jgi:two-component system, NarL family, nitrate/nitrite response regulator NarL
MGEAHSSTSRRLQGLPANARLRVFVVARVRLYRDGVVQALRTEPRFEVVGTATTGTGAIAGAAELEPDVVVLDVSAAEDLAEIRRLTALQPRPLVLAVGVADDPDAIVACAEAGAAGFVTSSQAPAELVAAVDHVSRGELLCSGRTAAAIFRRIGELAGGLARAAPSSLLTPRELEIARLVELKLTNREIAARLCIEPATVKNHVHNILAKLDAGSRDQVGALLNGGGPVVRVPGLDHPVQIRT